MLAIYYIDVYFLKFIYYLRGKESTPIHWFSPEMPGMARIGLGPRLKLRTRNTI